MDIKLVTYWIVSWNRDCVWDKYETAVYSTCSTYVFEHHIMLTHYSVASGHGSNCVLKKCWAMASSSILM